MEERREEGDRRGEILEAALRVFAEKGFKGATIKGIAWEAGVASPALIYWYFKDKEALFREVLETHVPILQAVADPASLMDLPPEEVLTKLGRAYLSFDRSNRILQLVLGEVIRRPDVAEMFIKGGPRRVLKFLEEYLERQVATGRLRPHDARSASRAYMGMLMPQIVGNVIFPALAEGGPTNEEHLKTATEIFLRGLAPDKGR